MLQGDDGHGHRALAISALVIVLTICVPAIRRASPSTQLPRCSQDEPATRVAKAPAPSGAPVSNGGYQLQGALEDLRCFLSLLCGFCGMHLLHTMQRSFEQQGTNDRRLDGNDDAVGAAQGPENQDVKLCFSVGM